MTSKKTLRSYLDEIRRCEDPHKLKYELKINDNWLVFLYGSPDKLFSNVTQAFRNSPQEDGIRDSWNYVGDGEGGRQLFFDYEPGTVHTQVTKGCFCFGLSEADKIGGLEHSVWVTFHPYQEKKMVGVNPLRAMALAIAGFGEYILRENLTARFPNEGLDLNYIPK